MRPRLLDLFSGAGGAAMGYYRAGFDVVGVDISPQPNYPFEFVQADALHLLDAFLGDIVLADGTGILDFDAIHASPPCQAFTIAQNARKQADKHPDLVTPLRPLLDATGLPYVIENVPGAPVRRDIVLCGTQFGMQHDGFELRRHRIFEINWPFGTLVPPCQHRLTAAPVFGHNAGRDFVRRNGRGFNAAARRQIMGIDWMTRDEVSESIPPVFTEFIGSQLMAHLTERAPVLAKATDSSPGGRDFPADAHSVSLDAAGYRTEQGTRTTPQQAAHAMRLLEPAPVQAKPQNGALTSVE